MAAPLIVYTVGHSNRGYDVLITALKGVSVQLLVDVRRYPYSRRNPRFNKEVLAKELSTHGVEYFHLPSLGGRRRPRAGSPNKALGDKGFRGFADYMGTPEFAAGLADVTDLAAQKVTAIMCAEALPWRCHRSLIADALVARGVEVVHLIGTSARKHALSSLARVEGDCITYPALL